MAAGGRGVTGGAAVGWGGVVGGTTGAAVAVGVGDGEIGWAVEDGVAVAPVVGEGATAAVSVGCGGSAVGTMISGSCVGKGDGCGDGVLVGSAVGVGGSGVTVGEGDGCGDGVAVAVSGGATVIGEGAPVTVPLPVKACHPAMAYTSTMIASMPSINA